jgi:tol-pal system protein YbgF
MRVFATIAVLLTVPFAAAAQGQENLADIRNEITGLMGQINGLKAQLQANNPAVTGVENPGPALQQISAIEEELRRLTGEIERLELYVGKVVEDGTREINDLRFRFTELEGGDIGSWEDVPPIGGERGDIAIETPLGGGGDTGTSSDTGSAQVALTEQVAFDEARTALQNGQYQVAAQKFADFQLNFPGGPLTSEAGFLRGEAFAAQGLWNDAARAYLDNFSGNPTGEKAADSLYMLGLSLGRLGQIDAACQTLGEVPRRFPALTPELAQKVQAEMGTLACS